MDINSLVQQITNEVVKQINNGGNSYSDNNIQVQQNQNSFTGNVNSVLVIINSNTKNINQIYSELKQLNLKYKVGILLSSTATRVIGRDNIMSNTGISTVYTDTGTRDESLYSYDSVILANITLSTLSKLANMINDSILTDVVINSVMSKKPVYICLDFIRYLMSINPTATSTIREYITKLKRMGTKEIKLSDINKFGIGKIPVTAASNNDFSGNDLKNLADAGAARIGANYGFDVTVPSEVANLIDHTLLKPDVTKDQIIKLCEEAKQYNFASVCVNPSWVKLCSELLRNTDVKVCTVIGFPLGATTTATKMAETREAISNGADEIDMVINIGALKAGDTDTVFNDIKGVVDSAQNHVVKVIIEATLLTDEEKILACKLSKQAGADYVKTSTGFAGGGATIADIALMRSVVGPDVGVKASGGVNDFNKAKHLLEVGATRIGASAGIAIVSGGKGSGAY